MQIKYEASISLSDSHKLIQDAEEATHNPFTHPQTGHIGYICCFYVANAGAISDQAKDNFFNTLPRRGIRDARLLDGNALLLLDKSSSLNRNANARERLAGLLQEVRVNRNLAPGLIADLQAYANDPLAKLFPIFRFRNSASANYLSAPFAISNLPVDIVDEFWQLLRKLNDVASSAGDPIAAGDFRKNRAHGFATLAPEMLKRGTRIEAAVVTLLDQLEAASIE